MSSPLRRAAPDEVPSVFELYRQRIHWMNRQGIRQWNVTEYLSVYPLSYYASCCTAGTLYVWQEAAVPITGSVVLLTQDSRWDDGETAATCYIHNLVTAPGCPGTGRRMPAAAERLAVSRGQRSMRLDCAEDNERLKQYYAAQGYRAAGRCREGNYRGILWEKPLPSE